METNTTPTPRQVLAAVEIIGEDAAAAITGSGFLSGATASQLRRIVAQAARVAR